MKGTSDVNWSPVQIQQAEREIDRSQRPARPCLAPLGVLACVAAYVLAGIFCAIFPPPLPSVDLGVTDAARCFAATRHADYVVVHVPMGTPVIRLRVLLMPRVHTPHTSAPHAPELMVWASRVFNSKSVACDEESVCSDVVLLNDKGPASERRAFAWSFDYYPIALAEHYYEVAYLLRMEGVLFVPSDMITSLTLTHICFEDRGVAWTNKYGASKLHLTVNAATGAMSTSVRDVQRADLPLPASPAAALGAELCGTGLDTLVQMFPPEAFRENAWLFATSTDYEHGHDAMEDRRAVIELGRCAENATDLHAEYSHVRFSCAATRMCRADPSLPLRRLSRSVLRLDTTNSSALLVHLPTALLDELPRLAEGNVHVLGAVGRVLLLALTALVIFVRSETSPSASKLFLQCCRVREEMHAKPKALRDPSEHEDSAAEKLEKLMAYFFERHSFLYNLLLAFYEDESKPEDFSLGTALEHCLVGLAAILARGLTVSTQFDMLVSDGNARVASIEFVLSVLNLLLWAVRWFGCDSHLDRTTLMGGSTAIVDATSAVIVAFALPPIRANANTFASIARMLTCVVLTFTCMVRTFFSTACCLMLFDSIVDGKSFDKRFEGLQSYASALLAAACVWMLQAAGMAVMVSDLLVTPAVDSFCWSATGSLEPYRLFGVLLMAALAMPRLTDACTSIVRGRNLEDEKSK